ncbi:MAG TPA: Rieske 2Fe-2S domain-containing protein [Planctomycetaceae bacterium]|jgi:Rieske Fe-S protein|nr:Rieske 2Fe-2S domain-containing protein [Planctomycetaceae bacterium]
MKTEEDGVTHFPDGRTEQRQPKWRRDFPIDVEADEFGARRDFTRFMVLTSLAFVVGQFWIGLQTLFRRRDKPARQRIATVNEIPIGRGLSFSYPTGRDPCLLIHASKGVFYAYSSQCTHLMCPVRPQLERNRLHCPCHEGSFEVETGRPAAGPPRSPLPRILLQVEHGGIYAIGVEVHPS